MKKLVDVVVLWDMDSNDIKNCWIMTYLGYLCMLLDFYLGWDENMPACATFEGCETITYYTISRAQPM